MKKQNSNTNRFLSGKQIVLIATLAFVGLYTFFIALPPTGAHFKYPLYIILCGKQPVVASEFMTSRSYRLPGTEAYKVYDSSIFFCTEQEAIDRGFEKYP